MTLLQIFHSITYMLNFLTLNCGWIIKNNENTTLAYVPFFIVDMLCLINFTDENCSNIVYSYPVLFTVQISKTTIAMLTNWKPVSPQISLCFPWWSRLYFKTTRPCKCLQTNTGFFRESKVFPSSLSISDIDDPTCSMQRMNLDFFRSIKFLADLFSIIWHTMCPKIFH